MIIGIILYIIIGILFSFQIVRNDLVMFLLVMLCWPAFYIAHLLRLMFSKPLIFLCKLTSGFTSMGNTLDEVMKDTIISGTGCFSIDGSGRVSKEVYLGKGRL